MTENAPTRRRWFQFGLRTMFVVVTIAALPLGWVAYSLKWIQDRHRCAPYEQDYGMVGSDDGTAPAILWLFGERGYNRLRVWFPDDPDEDHLTPEQARSLNTLRRLYPEALIDVVPPYTGVSIDDPAT